MKLTTIDSITRSILLGRGLPLHFYVRYLKFAIDCVRERTFDTLKNTNTVQLNLNSYFAVDLPCDFVGLITLGVPAGQFVMPVTQRNTINNLTNTGANGQPIPFGKDTSGLGVPLDFPFYPGFFLFTNVDDLGENLGRLYGLNTGLVNTSYKLVPSRNQIQFSEDFPSPTVILEYHSDGQCVDNMSKIDIRAQAMIEAYSIWKNSPNRDNMQSPEGRTFGHEWRLCRARLQNIGLEDIRQSILKGYNGSIKT